MTRRRIYLAQINTSFGDNAFLPYSVGLLWGNAMQDPRLRDTYELGEILFRRLPMQDNLAIIRDPYLVGISCYIWNWEYSQELARCIKSSWPGCKVVFGGPEVPNACAGFFADHPWADILVHGEGEATWNDLLSCLAMDHDISEVAGISFKTDQGDTVTTPQRSRIAEIDVIPSPYLTGVFDQLMQRHTDINWQASQETHRGCPYSCTFCDWGSAVYTKVRRFDAARLLDEITWFGENRINLLYNCDANYGIYERDIMLTRAITEAKHIHGYPQKFRASYAKKSDDKVFQISQILHKADMSKGVTLSLQSLSEASLDAVKRRNIAMTDFSGLVNRYRAANMPTYTEIILGLPGETEHSWRQGLESLLSAGQHDSINIYPCMLLRNSEMAQPSQIAQHGIRYAKMGISSNHGMAYDGDIREYQNVVIETATMDHAAWRRSYLRGWAVQAFHCLGLTQILSMDHRRHYGDHMGFYDKLIDLYANTDTVLGHAMADVIARLDAAIADQGDMDAYDPAFGQVMWPNEEFSFLCLQRDIDGLHVELEQLLSTWLEPRYMEQLLDYQRHMLMNWGDGDEQVRRYDWDFPAMHAVALTGDTMPLIDRTTTVRFTATRHDLHSIVDYAREIVWYGRKQGLQKKGVMHVRDQMGQTDAGQLEI